MDAWLKKKPAATTAASSTKAASGNNGDAPAASTSKAATSSSVFPKINVKSTAAPVGKESGVLCDGIYADCMHVQDPARQPWVEKYRPKSIDDVAAQDHTVSVLRKTLGSANVHLHHYPI